MAGERNFTRIPPESTGDRVYMVHTMYIPYDGANANYVWEVGERYYINGAGGDSIKVHVHAVFKDEGATSGVLSVHLVGQDRFNNLTPINDQDIRDESFTGTVRAQVNGTINTTNAFHDVYIPTQNIMGYDNPEYGLNVDAQGSAQITFNEGEPQLDAWGKLRTAGATKLGDYVFSDESVLTDNFSQVETRGGGANSWETTAFVTYDNTGKYVDVGVRNANDLATATAKTYHHYIAGSSHLFMGTATFPGAGTVTSPQGQGVSRRFGIFDAKNGFMFHVGPDGVLYLEQRNSNSGSKYDKLLACSDKTTADTLGIDTFNGDLLDGSRGALNSSGMLLDLTKNNQYWIDAQWHGSGRVRFGVFHNGRRVVVHEYYHNNRYDLPMNQTISLPVCTAVYAYTQAEIDGSTGVQTGNNFNWNALPGAVAKTASVDVQARVFSQAMWTETDINLQSIGKPKTYATGHIPITDTGFQYLFSLRVKPLAADGVNTNHSLIIPTRVGVISYDNDVANTGINRDAIVHWRMSVDTIHHNHQWSQIDGTNMEVSTNGRNFETAEVEKRILEDMYNGRGEKVLTDTFIDFQYGAWKNASDDGGTTFEPIASIDNSATGTVTASGVSNAGQTTITVASGASSMIPGARISGTGIDGIDHVMMIVSDTEFTVHKPLTTGLTGGEVFNYTNPVSVTLDTTNTQGWSLKEPYTSTFGPNPGYYKALNFDGMTLSSDEVYFYFTSKTTAVLYADADWDVPITNSGTYSGSNAQIYGFNGPDYVISFYGHEQVGYQDPRAMFVVEWKEIIQ